MLYLVQRILIAWVVLAVVLWFSLWSGSVAAYPNDSVEAAAACAASGSATAACRAAASGTSFNYSCAGPTITVPATYEGVYTCTVTRPDTGWTTNCGTGCGGVTYHWFTGQGLLCDDPAGTPATHYASGEIGDGGFQFPDLCHNDCEYQIESVGDCLYGDTNSNGMEDDGEPYECSYNYQSTGGECVGGDPNLGGTQQSPNYFDCTNVDCSPNPAPGGGSGETGSGGTLPGDTTGDNPGGTDSGGNPGDGDPDTGGGAGSGTGSGDIDGDGDRDIDCNPQSNPDCGYTGSGLGSGSCAAQPSCSGDPVACAILYQEWASMCYDGASFTNPSNCQDDLDCDGDVLLCEIIRQQRQQFCDAFVGDGTTDLDVTNNVDFNKDLKEEAEEIDLPSAFDQSGLGGGSCPADYPVSIGLGSFNVSFAAACDLAPAIRVFVIISAMFAAVFIVTGSSRRDSV